MTDHMPLPDAELDSSTDTPQSDTAQAPLPMVTLDDLRGLTQTFLDLDYERSMTLADNKEIMSFANRAEGGDETAQAEFIEKFGPAGLLQVMMLTLKLERMESRLNTISVMVANARTAFEDHFSPEQFRCEHVDHRLEFEENVPIAYGFLSLRPLCKDHIIAEGFWDSKNWGPKDETSPEALARAERIERLAAELLGEEPSTTTEGHEHAH